MRLCFRIITYASVFAPTKQLPGVFYKKLLKKFKNFKNNKNFKKGKNNLNNHINSQDTAKKI